MSRKTFIVVFAIFCIVLLTCAVAYNEEENKEDVQQIRDLLYREIDGHNKGDQEQIYSCYAPGFVGYGASGQDPEDWYVRIAGMEELRTKYAQNVKDMAANWAEHPDWMRIAEVRHVHVHNDHAIAVTSHKQYKPDPETRKNILNSHRSFWMLAKLKGKWKITGFGPVSSEQKIWELGPE